MTPLVSSSAESVLETEGLALARIVTSPVNIVGFTVAQCEGTGAGAVIIAPLALVTSCLPGTLATCTDILTGTGEMLTFTRSSRVAYPWESFDKERAEKWEEMTMKILDGAAKVSGSAAKVANDLDRTAHPNRYSPSVETPPSPAATGEGDVAPSSGSNGRKTVSSGPKVKPRVRHSSCGGTGKCPICRNRRVVGGKTCTGCGGSGLCRACRGSGYAP